MNNKKKSVKLIDYCVFGIVVLAVAIITYVLFYNQAKYSIIARETDFEVDLYHSDMYAYILDMQGLDSGYSFPYPVFFKLSALFDLVLSPAAAVALATTLLNVLALVFTKLSFSYLIIRKACDDKNDKLTVRMLITFVTTSLFFISMMIPPFGIYMGTKFRYLGIFSPNPFQNATYLAARPFAVVSFVYFCKLFEEYEGSIKDKKWDYIIFSIAFLLLTMTKPSFTIVLGIVAIILLVVRFFMKKCTFLWQTLVFGAAFIPALLDLLYQYKGVFVGDATSGERGIGFCLGDIWMQYTDNIVSSIVLAMGFPLVFLILNYRELFKNKRFMIAWICYAVSFVLAFFCYEKGDRAVDFNFSWSYMYGIFFAFFASAELLIKKTVEKENRIATSFSWLTLLYHLGSGIYFFVGLYGGGNYY